MAGKDESGEPKLQLTDDEWKALRDAVEKLNSDTEIKAAFSKAQETNAAKIRAMQAVLTQVNSWKFRLSIQRKRRLKLRLRPRQRNYKRRA